MHIRNRNTGTEKLQDMTQHGIELVCYAYKAEDIQPPLDSGHTVTYDAKLRPLPEELAAPA